MIYSAKFVSKHINSFDLSNSGISFDIGLNENNLYQQIVNSFKGKEWNLIPYATDFIFKSPKYGCLFGISYNKKSKQYWCWVRNYLINGKPSELIQEYSYLNKNTKEVIHFQENIISVMSDLYGNNFLNDKNEGNYIFDTLEEILDIIEPEEFPISSY